jgi:CHAD domain-containing protein/HD superfamily phosphodiesterase
MTSKRDIREQMQEFYERFDMDRSHAEHVADMCNRIYRDLPHLHGLTKTCRPLVEMTGLLHDIAEADGKKGHDLSGAARLRKTPIPFVPRGWKPLIAQAVALHSKRSDVKSFLARLAQKKNPRLELAARLGAILRIADGLDHCRKQDTRIRAIVDDGKAVTIYLADSASAEENARFAFAKADLWNRLSPRPIGRIVVVRDKAPRTDLVRPRQPMRQAARAMLQRQFEQLASREYGLGYAEDPEYVHEMRVAIRRMLVLIHAFDKDLGSAIRPIGKNLANVGGRLGDVRDSDAFLAYVQECLDQAPPSRRRVLVTIRNAQRRARREQYRRVVEQFAGAEYGRLKSRLGRFLAAGAGGRRGRQPAAREVKRALQRYLEQFFSYGRRLAKLSPKQQHELRIDCKNLRYLADFFRGFYGPRLGGMIDELTEFQDLLGQVHDYHVYKDWLPQRAAAGSPKGREAVQTLLDDLQRRREQALDQAGRMWKSLAKGRCKKRFERLIKN